ncbi:MAG: sugar transferase [Firmicutes bacterium]|nr:sugar transferase [Bacillota bacterium]
MKKRGIYEVFIKRVLDLTMAFLAVLFLSWFLLFIALLVRIKHGKGVIYKQRRVGRNKRVFWFYKFRSMSNAKDEDGNLLPDTERLTRFGKFLRRTSIDELPQLFNIIKGDMSFIGPRPKDVKECVFFNEEQRQRFLSRPGISGLAQVNGRNAFNFEHVSEYDNKYVKKVTLWRDIKIFFKTFFVVLKPTAVDAESHGFHMSEYYCDLLLKRKEISIDDYTTGVMMSGTIKVGEIMPEFEWMRTKTKSAQVVREGIAVVTKSNESEE